MKTHCRCRVCGARQVKPKHPEEYVRGPRCRACYRINTLRKDRWMHTRYRKGVRTCTCDGYWFPHRMGSLYCFHRKNGEERQYGDPDFRHRDLDEQAA